MKAANKLNGVFILYEIFPKKNRQASILFINYIIKSKRSKNNVKRIELVYEVLQSSMIFLFLFSIKSQKKNSHGTTVVEQ